jgi:hypothetical protein
MFWRRTPKQTPPPVSRGEFSGLLIPYLSDKVAHMTTRTIMRYLPCQDGERGLLTVLRRSKDP